MALALAITALIVAFIALPFSILSYIEVKAQRLSTHTAVFEPYSAQETSPLEAKALVEPNEEESLPTYDPQLLFADGKGLGI